MVFWSPTSQTGREAGGRALIVAPKIGGTKSVLVADVQLAGFPSVMVNAIALELSKKGCEMLLVEAAAIQFVMDAFGHLKAIGATEAAKPLLDKAGVEPDAGIVPIDERFVQPAGRRYWDREHKIRTLA